MLITTPAIFVRAGHIAPIQRPTCSYHLDFADFADFFVVAKLLHLPEALLRVRYPASLTQPLILDNGNRDEHPGGLFLRALNDKHNASRLYNAYIIGEQARAVHANAPQDADR